MPELPEVETVKSVLEKVVNGRTIQKIDILRSSSVPGDKEQFVSSLTGEKFLRMSRIGKFLIFHLTNDKVIISHLRMEGKYYELEENEPNTKYARVVLHLDNGHSTIQYDFYDFFHGNPNSIFVFYPLMLSVVYVIGIVLYTINKKYLKK